MKASFPKAATSSQVFFALAALLLVAFFCYLGSWQLQRALEKEAMLANYVAQKQAKALPWSGRLPNPRPYQNIVLQGQYMQQALLLDNQYYHHQIGYHVLVPVILDDGKAVLVDRGWTKAGFSREQLPKISIATGPLTLVGSAYYPSRKNWALDQIFDKKMPGLAVIETVNIPIISQFLQKPLYPFIMRLDEQAKDVYIRDWQSQIVAMPPKRHQAYAFQWFMMALSTVVIYAVLWWKRKHDKNFKRKD